MNAKKRGCLAKNKTIVGEAGKSVEKEIHNDLLCDSTKVPNKVNYDAMDSIPTSSNSRLYDNRMKHVNMHIDENTEHGEVVLLS